MSEEGGGGSLNIGTLAGILQLDDRPFQKGIDKALQDAVKRLDGMVAVGAKVAQETAKALADPVGFARAGEAAAASAGEGLGGLVDGAGAVGADAAGRVGEGLQQLVTTGAQVATDTAAKLAEPAAFKEAGQKAGTAAGDAIATKVAEGAAGAGKGAAAAIAASTSTVKDAADLVGVEGGKSLGTGVAKGIDQEKPKDLDKVRELTRAMIEVMKGESSRAERGLTRSVVSDLGSALSAGMLAAGTGAAIALFKGFSEASSREAASAKLGAQMGWTPAQAAIAGQVAGKIYASGFGSSVGDANDAIKATIQNGVAGPLTGKKPLQDLAEQALQLKDIFGQDLGGSTQAVADMLKNGLAKNAQDAFDTLTVGLQKGGDKGGDLLATMSKYGPTFKKLGLTGAQAMALIVQGLKNGAPDADTVVAGLKKINGVKLIGAVEGLGKIRGAAKAAGDEVGGTASAKFEKLKREALDKLVSFITADLIPAFDKIAAVVGPFFDTLKAGWAAGGFDGLVDKFKGIWPAIRDALGNVLGNIWDWLKQNAPLYYEHWGEMLKSGSEALLRDIPNWLLGLGHLLGKMGSWILDVGLPKLVGYLEKWVPAFRDWLGTNYQPYMDKLGGLLASLGNWIVTTALPVINTHLQEWAKAFGGWVEGTAWPWLKQELAVLIVKLVYWFETVAEPWMKTQAKSLWKHISDGLDAAGHDVTDYLAKLPGKAITALGNLGDTLFQDGEDLIDGLVRGMEAYAGTSLQRAAISIAEGLPGWMREVLGIHSPSTVMAELGRNVMAGATLGMLEQAKADERIWVATFKHLSEQVAAAMVVPSLSSRVMSMAAASIPSTKGGTAWHQTPMGPILPTWTGGDPTAQPVIYHVYNVGTIMAKEADPKKLMDELGDRILESV